ncbi:MAG: diguanylate cyclase [Synergistaceae bacterium]|jgi:diguanylate cyclase (GGDEF)-like protein/PAS domain S-box-containing protein|nr:diguanylate cyclase [Synergistaceae bacterium]
MGNDTEPKKFPDLQRILLQAPSPCIVGGVFLCFTIPALFLLRAVYLFPSGLLPAFALVAGICSVLTALLTGKQEKKPAQVRDALSLVMDVTGGCYWEWWPESGRMKFTPGGLSVFGKDIVSLDGFVSLIHPDDVEMFRKAAENSLLPDENLASDLRMQSAQGEWRWFMVRSASIQKRPDGTPVLVRGAMVDIDDYRRAVEAMEGSEKRLAAIFKSAPGSIVVTDDEGRVLDANQAFYDMLGYSAGELRGIPIMSLLEVPRKDDPKVLMSKLLQECESYEDSRFHMEERFVRRDGRISVIDFGLSVLVDYDGNIQNYIFSGIDITQQIKRAEELKLLTENQRWLFDFLRQFNEFHGVPQLFEALRANLPQVVSFSSLRLVVPSFMGRAWVLDDRTDFTKEATTAAVEAFLSGKTPLGECYVERSPLAWGALPRTMSGLDADPRSVMAIPLIYREHVWGVLGLENSSLDAFTEQDLTMISIVGGNIGLYFEEQSQRMELDRYTDSLQRLHSLIHTLLKSRNRDHLLEGMLEYLKNALSDFACAIYLFTGPKEDRGSSLELLAWHNAENIALPDTAPILNAAARGIPVVEYSDSGQETRWIVPIVFQKQSVGVIDLFKPSGLLPAEVKIYQLLTDYVAGFWMLYNIMALREEEASVDPLTGIWNRRYMIRRLQEESDRIGRYGGNACLVIGDMGNFKQINDTYGHTRGDEVLIQVARTIKKTLRLSDSVGRYGGDEFILLLPNVSKQDAEVIVERIRQGFAQLKIPSDDSDPDSPLIHVVMDFGLALYPGGATSLLDTINLADEAMYANKIARKERLSKTEKNEVER